MENRQTISGPEAIRRARNLKYVSGASATADTQNNLQKTQEQE